MAEAVGEGIGGTVVDLGESLASPESSGEGLALGGISSTSYLMRALDSGRAAGSNYICWTGSSPDYSGAGYSSGSPTPISSMVGGSVVVIPNKR